jgi:hypothetical protein
MWSCGTRDATEGECGLPKATASGFLVLISSGVTPLVVAFPWQRCPRGGGRTMFRLEV